MDMRFFWLRDRVKQQQFVVEHIPGQYNVADFFTKALPKLKFDQFHRYLVVNRNSLEVEEKYIITDYELLLAKLMGN